MTEATAVGIDEMHVGLAGMITVLHDCTPDTLSRVLLPAKVSGER